MNPMIHMTQVFIAETSDWSDDSDEENIKDDSVPHPAQERKFIVFESSLDQLIGKITCSICGKPQSDMKKFPLG